MGFTWEIQMHRSKFDLGLSVRAIQGVRYIDDGRSTRST